MRKIVFDVAASEGGALSVLYMYYNKALKEKDNQWIFVLSKPMLESKENIKVLRYPWIKKSWFHRLFFEIFIAHRIIAKYKGDKIISLQNIMIFGTKLKQEVYLHQTLIFAKKKYKIYESATLWTIQNVMKHLIFFSIKKSDKVIVQTNWLKDECLKSMKINEKKIEVDTPDVKIDAIKKFKYRNNEMIFFYPASGVEYKNHEIIVNAVDKLIKKESVNFKIVLTLSGDESKKIRKIYNLVKGRKLPIDFIGKISKDEVFEYYSKSILVFPSYVESFGLPLLEAKMHETPIIASDCSFSHEILDDYNNVEFFDPFNIDSLVNIIEKFLLKGNIVF